MYTKIDSLYPFCYPINYKTDISELHKSIEVLLHRLGLSYEEMQKKCDGNFGASINLTHLPGLQGSDRWEKYKEKHPIVKQQGVNEKDFTELLAEAQDLLIGKVIKTIYKLHNGKFQGRTQLVWLSSKKSYKFHTDYHTKNRYHVPIITNDQCFWLFRKNENQIPYYLHMPADGRVWYLDPINMEHTFCNESNTCRLHLLLTSAY